MTRDRKGYNTIIALREAGYDSLQLSKRSKVIGNKNESMHAFMVWSRSRNGFHPGTDIRMMLDESDIQKIADVGYQKGFLTFIDREFNMSNAREFLVPGHQEIGIVFFPSHLVGRMKRLVSKARKEVIEQAPFLQEDFNYVKLWKDLKIAQDNLLFATKYAVADQDGDMPANSFQPVCSVVNDIRMDIYDFRKAIGIADKPGASFTEKQEKADAVVAELHTLAIQCRGLM